MSFLLMPAMLFTQTSIMVNGNWMICFTPKEYQDLQDKTKQILEDTSKQVAKDTATPLLAQIASDNVQLGLWSTKYDVLYQDYKALQCWNITGWSVSAAELGALIVKIFF
jgi:hypothetical protein